ncbi:DUF1592 domain-containing protein [Prosthecobacter sp.]|uniref:DUF1592 domain-containing protein n=1 Tax=Prosthecobacter sp. TaxID=1965333 RepID=UPI0024894309|nr:DUF1592 domain-containing protein [Prosthecobacter sp.]MDI1312694.1 DUF1592 domain-containing protein [Prosthecobacter sp.]
MKSTEDTALQAMQTEVKKDYKNKVEPFVKTYCVECHGNRKSKGGINFEVAVRKPGVAPFSEVWANAYVNVNAHDMPPEDDDKQPTDAERQGFLDIIAKTKYLSTKDPGPFVIRRLTKTEYGNTLHDLLGVDAAVAAELPDEVPGEGYMNSLSPLQSEQYLSIANEALTRALAAPGAPPTAVQKRLLGEAPAAGADLRAEAGKIARSLARSAYRRPPSAAEVATLVAVFELGRANKLDHAASLRLMLKAVLVSPQFLFITPAKEAAADEKIVPLDDHQLAARLSYLLWATMPDAQLSELADVGKLHEPAILKAQVKRLLSDPRARALFDGFGAQWLGLAELGDKTFDTKKFPQMTGAMRTAMYDEARLFFDSIVREDRSVVGFVDSDYTYLNGTLAALYGLEKTVTGPEMRKVKLTNANRGGILGMPGILATTSFPNRTSPVKRGVWVLEQVLGQKVPPAPPNVPTLEKQDPKKAASMTLRQRTELHRTNAVCANCHKILDPIGFGLENFDAIGRWRDQDDTGGAIDAVGELPGGKHFSTPKELKAIIAARKDDMARNLTEKLMAYALCRKLEGYDEIVVDGLMQTIAKDGFRMQTIIAAIVTSYPFMNRRLQ